MQTGCLFSFSSYSVHHEDMQGGHVQVDPHQAGQKVSKLFIIFSTYIRCRLGKFQPDITGHPETGGSCCRAWRAGKGRKVTNQYKGSIFTTVSLNKMHPNYGVQEVVHISCRSYIKSKIDPNSKFNTTVNVHWLIKAHKIIEKRETKIKSYCLCFRKDLLFVCYIVGKNKIVLMICRLYIWNKKHKF